MSCEVGEVTESLENDLSVTSPTSQLILILQDFRHFTYVTAHSPTLPSVYLRHNSFSNPSVASPTSQLILQPFPRFTYVTVHSPTLLLLHLRHSSFSNPSFASPTSQDFHLRHLASRPCHLMANLKLNACMKYAILYSRTREFIFYENIILYQKCSFCQQVNNFQQRIYINNASTRCVHKVSFPLVPQLVNHLLCKEIACT